MHASEICNRGSLGHATFGERTKCAVCLERPHLVTAALLALNHNMSQSRYLMIIANRQQKQQCDSNTVPSELRRRLCELYS